MRQPRLQRGARRCDGYELRERRYANRCPIELLEIRYRVNRDEQCNGLKSAVVLTDPNCSSSF